MNNARKPSISMYMTESSKRNVSSDITRLTISRKSTYDWKSVHAQKYFQSKSVMKDTTTRRKRKQ